MAIDGLNIATLRISSDKLSIEEMTRELDTEPTETIRRGQLASRRNPRSKRSEENRWMRQSPLGEDAKLTDQILDLIGFLESKADAIDLLKDDCGIDTLCVM